MADEASRQEVMEVTEGTEVTDLPTTEDVAARADSKAPGGEGGPKDSMASSPASTGKRPMDDTVEDQVEDQNQRAEPPRKKPRHKKARKETAATEAPKPVSSDSIDEGEVDSEGASKKTASALSDGQDSASSLDGPSTTAAPAAAPPGLRTSFGTGFQNSSKNVQPRMLMYNPLTAEERTQLVGAIQAGESRDVPPTKKRGLEWSIPSIRTDWIVGATWLEIFNSMVDKWCGAFVAKNQTNIDEVGLAPSFLKQTFLRCFEADVTPNLPRMCGQTARQQLENPDNSRLREFGGEFKPDLKKAAKRAAKKEAQLAKDAELRQQATSGASITSNSTVSTSRPSIATTDNDNDNPPPSTKVKMDVEMKDSDNIAGLEQQESPEIEMEDGEIDSVGDNDGELDLEEDETGSPTPEVELGRRRRYFPQVSDDAVFCLTCAQYGHKTAACPETTCKYCHGDHFKYECLTRQRCIKCKQLGHPKGSCPEKLAVAPGEAAMQCAVCEFHDHTEKNCSELWQTYRPQSGNVKKVRSLPVFCYCCGNEGHFGGDCGLADPSTPPTKTWTMATASFYIDHESNEDALTYKDYLPPPPASSKPVIPGRSIKPQSHVVYESDDSGEVDGFGFLHAPAAGQIKNQKQSKKQQKQGAGTKIQIKSNINFGAAASAVRPGPSTQQQQNQNQLVETLPGPKTSGRRYPERQRNEALQPKSKAPPQPRARGGKNHSLRNGRDVPKAGQGEHLTRKEHQQMRQAARPPLPPGPAPSHFPTGGGGHQGAGGGRAGRGGGAGRGRGGFSGLSKRNRSRRGGSK